MRKFACLAAIGAVIGMTPSCGRTHGNDTDTTCCDVVFVDGFDDFNSGDIDTVFYDDDGSYGLYGMGFSPMNSLLEYFDNEGRVLLTQAQASECEPQTLVYRYDNSGLLSEILSINFPDSIYNKFYSEGVTARNIYNFIDSGLRPGCESVPLTSISEIRFERSYDNQRIISISGLFPIDEIVAPPDKSLSIRIRPADSFWESDLHGGRYVIEIASVN